MPMERVLEFLYDLVGNEQLREQLSKTNPVPEAWLQVARRSGYEFTEEEFRTVAEEIVQKPLAKGTYIQQLADALTPTSEADFQSSVSPQLINRLKAVLQQGRFADYARPW